MDHFIKKIFLCTVLLLFVAALVSVILYDTYGLVPEETDSPREESVQPANPYTPHSNVQEETSTEPDTPHYNLNPKPQYSFPNDFYTTLLPNEWFADCPEPGTVYSVIYNATDVSTGTPITKKMDVYLPYGYSNRHRYDVLILTHGAGHNESYWFSGEQTYNGVPVSAKNLIDNVIYVGSCRQLIVVSCSFRNEVSCNGTAYDVEQLYLEGQQMSEELKNDILPFLAENFSTYAENGSAESLIAAREHFAFAGMSWGAMIGYVFLLPQDLEYISWYGLLGASTMNIRRTISALNEKTAQYPISYIYSSVGSLDDIRKQSEDLYRSIVLYCTGVTEGENACHVSIDPARHTFNAWGTDLYNCLLCFFST